MSSRQQPALSLYPFQEAGVAFITSQAIRPGRGIIGDDMGLGKTPQALKVLEHYDARRSLIVAPASVVFKWADEIEKWVPGWSHTVITSSKDPLPVRGIAIMSYTLMTMLQNQLSKLRWEAAVLDECHYLKSYKAKRYKAAEKVVMGIPKIIGLSGTPFLNRPEELFNMLHIIDPLSWADRYEYWKKYCALKKKYFHGRTVLDYSGASNIPHLKLRMERYMIRRLKSEVRDQLPALTRTHIQVNMGTKRDYEDYNLARFNVVKYLEKEGKSTEGARKAEHLVALNQLRHILGRGKVVPVVSLAKEILDQEDDRKLVIYAIHKDVVKELVVHLHKYGVRTITGDVDPKERAIRNKAFQEQAYPRVMIVSAAGGEGIDLYRANHIIFAEREWNPGKEGQAEARVDRLGQTMPVTAYYLVARNTIDEKISDLIESKRSLLDQLIGSEEVETTIISDLMAYLKGDKA